MTVDDPIDMKKWRATPAIEGRTATDDDVAAGRAVFAVGGEPVAIDLPACAIISEEGVGEPTPVIAIQVERLEDGSIAVGYRFLEGGSEIADFNDVEFLDEPDERFR
ncbi:MAG TPA: hypothetical protein VFN10_03160 [Thermoanaerobaculia bacterium]|nr:hypothetical protein [Thermoanaerobaculia bacterium]